jgi:hypothetical protein
VVVVGGLGSWIAFLEWLLGLWKGEELGSVNAVYMPPCQNHPRGLRAGPQAQEIDKVVFFKVN